jgi:pyridoxine 5-phosphate synthase
MAATEEMVAIALRTKPHAACIVPEKRTERTTEGGLEAADQHDHLAPVIAALNDAGIRVSLFIAAEPRQIEAAARLHAPVIEIHTGAWCDALIERRSADAQREWQRICDGVAMARDLGLEIHAGHGLDYASAERIATLGDIRELNIGHFLVGEAIFEGLPQTITLMRAAMDRGRARAG